MRLLVTPTLGALALGAALLVPRTASADLASCGNIHVEAQAQCVAEVDPVKCEARCTDLRFEAACSARLYAQCSGQCNASAEASCTGTCEGTCAAKCQQNPNFNCTVDCQAQASAHCQGECSTNANRSQCEASCKATFTGECDAACNGSPVECQGKCQASCEGQCTARANVDCNVSCQSSGYAQCETNLEGKCRGDCTGGDGTLACDGEYVDHGNNLEQCVNALKAQLNITVTGYANADCSGNTCEAEAGASCECGLTKNQAAGGSALLWALGGLGALTMFRRKRRFSAR
jgi:MYXO-CTERM domain-containing protein